MIKKSQHIKLVVILILGFVFAGAFYFFSNNEKSEIADFSKDIIELCSSEEYRPGCYDLEIPKLLNELTLSQVFDIVREVQSQDEEYGYCHVLGHKLGELEVAKDPQDWMSIVTRCPADGICANGCLHGALIERFSSDEQWSLTDEQIEEAKPDLNAACEPREGFNPTPLDKAICYHGLGHLTVYMTNADLPRALNVCDDISLKENGENYLGVCYEGIFMQLFQPLEPEDFALIESIDVTKENLVSFCNSFSTQGKRQACFSEGWPVFSEEVRTPEGLVNYCLLSEDKATQNHCFRMLFYTTGQGANFDEVKIREFCSEVSSLYRGQCFRDAARSMIQADPKFIDDAVEVCAKVPNEDDKDICYDGIAEYASYRFHSGSDLFNDVCEALPEPWSSECSQI